MEGNIVELGFKPNSHFQPDAWPDRIINHVEGTMWIDEVEKRLV
jgi:hypothetical protein